MMKEGSKISFFKFFINSLSFLSLLTSALGGYLIILAEKQLSASYYTGQKMRSAHSLCLSADPPSSESILATVPPFGPTEGQK